MTELEYHHFATLNKMQLDQQTPKHGPRNPCGWVPKTLSENLQSQKYFTVILRCYSLFPPHALMCVR